MRVFVGVDDREFAAYHVCAHSIMARASAPLTITPLYIPNLKGIYKRPPDPKATTQFSASRFLVPALCGYRGLGLFMDSDMLVRCDLIELGEEIRRQPGCAVWCCQHDYTPSSTVKFLNQPQSVYPRKNWSSLVLYDCSQCEALTPEYVNTASGLDLHRFNWLPSTHKIGKLPLEWNWLVGEYPHNPQAKVLHYTLGGPYFPGYENCDHAEEWRSERDAAFSPVSVVPSLPPDPRHFC